MQLDQLPLPDCNLSQSEAVAVGDSNIQHAAQIEKVGQRIIVISNVEVTGAARLYRAASSDRRERGRPPCYAPSCKVRLEIVDERGAREKKILSVTLIDVGFIKHCMPYSVVVVRIPVQLRKPIFQGWMQVPLFLQNL